MPNNKISVVDKKITIPTAINNTNYEVNSDFGDEFTDEYYGIDNIQNNNLKPIIPLRKNVCLLQPR